MDYESFRQMVLILYHQTSNTALQIADLLDADYEDVLEVIRKDFE